MAGIIQLFEGLGLKRIAAIILVSAMVMTLVIFMMARMAAPDMRLLYTGLDQSDASQIANQLSAMNEVFELRNNGTEVLVMADRVADLRLLLAEQGYAGKVVGNELFDQDEGFGTSSRQQAINERRALEGELSRTISSIEGVKSARVHIVLPQRELFSRDVRDPSASIIIDMQGARRLEKGQVSAIQYLVATAVDRLKPSAVTIADNRGTLLARGGDDDDQLASMAADELRLAYERRLAQRIEELVESIVGFGRVRAEVSAEIEMNQIVENVETYDPEGQVLRSTEAIEENSSLSEAGEDAITIGNNLPDGGADAADGGTRENTSRTEERSNFEISRTVINTVKAPGEVRAVSIAVLVDGTYTPGEVTEEVENPEPVYQPRTAQEMEQIDQLVKSAIGYDDGADTVRVVNMRFAQAPDLGDGADGTILGVESQTISRLVELVVMAVLFILLVFLVVRPLLSKVFETSAPAIAGMGEDEQALLTDQTGGAEETGRHVVGGVETYPDDVADEMDQMIDIAHIEGRVKASSMKKVGEIIEKHPEEAVSILRNWMYQEN
ncbi:MAG: flagellar basal-body MS-ring/collar protein FliF [Alphaproteobacteria bacterium]